MKKERGCMSVCRNMMKLQQQKQSSDRVCVCVVRYLFQESKCIHVRGNLFAGVCVSAEENVCVCLDAKEKYV